MWFYIKIQHVVKPNDYENYELDKRNCNTHDTRNKTRFHRKKDIGSDVVSMTKEKFIWYKLSTKN